MADTSTSNPQPYQFKASDIASIGSIFGDGTPKGAKLSSNIDTGINMAGAGAMSYAMGNTGGKTSYQKKLNKLDTGFNAVTAGISMIPGIGQGVSAVLQGANWLGGKLGKKANKIGLAENVGSASGYTGTASAIGDQATDISAQRNAGGFAKLFSGRKDLNAETARLKAMQAKASGILNKSQGQFAALGSASQTIGMKNQLDFNNPNQNQIRVGKTGLNTEFLKEFHKFKTGGTIEAPQNVIVDGKLHKELNHMEDITETDITRKGIPVLAMSEGGELGDQTAELERDEIIFHLQLTKKLEELAKENTDESMIEAGKILAKEILKNTKDSKSKLLKTVQ